MGRKIISIMLIIILILMSMPLEPIAEWLSSHAATTVWEYNYTGGGQTFTSPATGIYQIDAYGAQGGNTSGEAGGLGSYTTGRILLSKNQAISLYVGGQDGYNGGGAGNTYQAVGGGATDVRLNGNAVENRILVAAGGGGAYTQVNYHHHVGDGTEATECRTESALCWRKATKFTPVTDADHWIDYVDAYFEHTVCGMGTEYVAKGRYYYGEATGASKWEAINGPHYYYPINCTKTEGVTVDSYTNIAGRPEETSNGIAHTGQLGGGGGFYGGITNYAGTNYGNPTYLTNIGAAVGQKTGNGYVKITLISAYPVITYNYQTNGGNWANATSLEVANGTNANLGVVATKPGWTHIGWNTDPNATTGLTSYIPTNDTTLYAIFSKTLTGTFVDLGGTRTRKCNHIQ